MEKRPAGECVEMPFCKACYMPMVLEEVSIKEIAAKD
jgi:hypothetical protein